MVVDLSWRTPSAARLVRVIEASVIPMTATNGRAVGPLEENGPVSKAVGLG